MKKVFLRGIHLALAFILMLTAIGCGRNQQAANNGSREKLAISIWHIWPEGNSTNSDIIQKVLMSMNEKYPEIDFEVDAVADSGDNYKLKIKAAIAANEAPDIFFTWGGGWSKSFVDSGKVLPLDKYLNDGTLDKLIDGTLTYLKYDEKTYALPLSVNVAMLFYNTELFEQYRLQPPKTFEELIEVCKIFRSHGMTPLAMGGKDQWTIAMVQNGLALKTAGSDYCNKALAGEASFETSQMKKSVELLQELYRIGAFSEGVLGISKDESQVPFLEGRIPMYYNGSWIASDVYKSEKVRDKIRVVNMPLVTGGDGRDTEFLGGADQTFMINADTQNKKKVVEVYKYMIETLSKERYLNGVGAPTWRVDYDTSEIKNKLLVEIVDQYSRATGLTLWWNTVLTGKNSQAHEDAVARALIGRMTPDEFVTAHEKLSR